MGLAVTFDYIFTEQDFEYEETAPVRRMESTELALYDPESIHGRKLVKFGRKRTQTFPGGSFPLQVATTTDFTVDVGARFTKKYWRLFGSGWFNWDPCKIMVIAAKTACP